MSSPRMASKGTSPWGYVPRKDETLSRWGDAGWGRLVARGKDAGHFPGRARRRCRRNVARPVATVAAPDLDHLRALKEESQSRPGLRQTPGNRSGVAIQTCGG